MSVARKAKRIGEQRAAPKLSTLGYEGLTLESYVARLVENSTTLLCDVRRNAVSRKRGFSKKGLSHACAEAGIRYEHLPELGIASEKRKALVTQADRDALFEEYARNWLPKQGAALSQIRRWLDSGERVTLTCFEKLPSQCHRRWVAEALNGVSVEHL